MQVCLFANAAIAASRGAASANQFSKLRADFSWGPKI